MPRFVVLFKCDNESDANAALKALQSRYEVRPSSSYDITEVGTNYTPDGLMASAMRCNTTRHRRFEVLSRKRKPTAIVSGTPTTRSRSTSPPPPLPMPPQANVTYNVHDAAAHDVKHR
ncbi:uncharacterized protein LOC128991051 [Macrosteles quadrilineatus]|uniref:uncharacterized protein LOC128991051 n=1 Tax=Macrosteles quadrilineatus TaxID=74068 RepID=UPI0023E240F2|nr:uncharacterized protein LOC128991051 [Macrosteles quadrilineatus]